MITDADLYVLKEQALLDSDLPSAERPAHACTGPSTCSICADQSKSGAGATTLQTGDTVVYLRSGEHATVLKVHRDDPAEVYVTVTMPDGREKQTTLDHLKAVLGGAGGIEIGDGSPNGAASHDTARPTTAGADRAVINDQPVQSVAATLADHHITLYTNVKNDSRWSAYVSYRPHNGALVTARTLHASTRSAVQSRAEDLVSIWRQTHNNQSATEGRKRKRNRQKWLVPGTEAVRPKRGATAAPKAYAEKKYRPGTGIAGPGAGHKSVPSKEVSAEMQIWEMNIQVCNLRKMLRNSEKETETYRAKWDAISALLASCDNDIERAAQSQEGKGLIGTGYSDEELERTVYRHIDFVLSAIDDKVGGDPVKKAQLAKYVARKCNGATVAVEDKQATAEAHTKELVATALKDYLSHVKQTYSGRYPTAVRAAYQSVLVAVAGNAPPRTLTAIGKFLGIKKEQLYWARDRWEEYLDGEVDSTWIERYEASRKMNPKWTEFIVSECWLDDEFTRQAEQAKHVLHNPHDHSDKELKPIRWLEMSNQEMLERVLQKGKAHFKDPNFTCSSRKLRELKPWWIRSAGREVCLCRYHLGWDLYASALYGVRKRVRDAATIAGQSLCSCVNRISGSLLRRDSTCSRPEGEDWRDRACVNGTCDSCGGGKKFPVCGPELEQLKEQQVEYEKWFPEEGDVKADFRETTASFKDFFAEMKVYFHETLLPHHDKASWQDHDWSMQNTTFPRFTFVSVRDFAEGYSHAVKNQHQSAYFAQPRSNLYPVVMNFDARDLNDLFFEKYAGVEDGAVEKARILAGFEELNLRPIITFTLGIITPDHKKDFAFVRHVDEEIIIPFVREIGINGPDTFKCHYVRSDGCKAQFKCKDAFWWMSQYHRKFKIHLDWSYFCSCHGTCELTLF